jgi:hypothetical protein
MAFKLLFSGFATVISLLLGQGSPAVIDSIAETVRPFKPLFSDVQGFTSPSMLFAYRANLYANHCG